MMPENRPRPEPGAFWGRGWFWCLLALASVLPFIFSPLPMMPDYLAHMARYHVMNHGAESPFLQRYYSFRWALIGNLGIDLLMVPLGAIWPTETAARIAAASIPVLTIAGIYAVGRATWGQIEAPALLALPFVYSFTFLHGFVNYHFAVALALLVFAAWIKLAPRRAWLRWLVFAPLAMAVWVAHIAGWAVLLLLIGCWEFRTALGTQSNWRAGPGAIFRASVRALPVALPLLVTLISRSRYSGEPHPYSLLNKPLWISWVLRSESMIFDYAAMALLAFAGLWLFDHDQARRDRRLMLSALVIFLCFMLLPQYVFGSNYADTRLLPLACMVFFLGLGAPTNRSATMVAMLGLTLFGSRLAATTLGWHTRGENAMADLMVLDRVPRGARIAVLHRESISGPWELHGFETLGSLAIIRREAFVNTEWDLPGTQLMRPIYNHGRSFNGLGSGLVQSQKEDFGRPVPIILEALPRDRFDFVWFFEAAPTESWLVPVGSGPDGRLYQIIRETRPTSMSAKATDPRVDRNRAAPARSPARD